MPSLILALYTAAIFASATLLFLVQPMFARMTLPLLGGSPGVWNTAMVCFQALLLAGYLYAHAVASRAPLRLQVPLHLGVVLLPLLTLPIDLRPGSEPPGEGSPIPWMLAAQLSAVGLPFFVVSTTSPLLQKWFSATEHRSAGDPYFLYAASNLGSMLALLGYPAFFDPAFDLGQQSRIWAAGYWLYAALVAACGLLAWRTGKQEAPRSEAPSSPEVAATGGGQRLRWVALSAVPSSLMLSVTTYLSTDVAAVPLLWVVPLALYLLTFILCFSSRQWIPHDRIRSAFPILAVALVLLLLVQATEPIGLLIALHLLTFFAATMVCHGELARSRPAARRLTEFYFWMSLGGVIGGAFNALLAPLIFDSVAEYPIGLVAAALLMGAPHGSQGSFRKADLVVPALLGLGTAALLLAADAAGFGGSTAVYPLLFGLPVLLCYFASRRPVRFGLALGAVLLAGSLHRGGHGRLLHAERSFFGVHRVTQDREGRFRQLLHGHTLHGRESLDPSRQKVPLTYYYPSGPIGQVLQALPPERRRRVGVVGLGVGSLAAYARKGEEWTFYEIDPVVKEIATDPRFFTYLGGCAGAVRLVMGDARLSLARERAQMDLLVLDAYSSDSVPVHLLTREALQLYFDRLAPDGILAFHVSNLHLDLKPLLGVLAEDAGVPCLSQDDTDLSPEETELGKTPSEWVVMARTPAALDLLARDPRWRPQPGRPGLRVWTDHYSSILSVLTWR